jgi:hypothetical protein
VWVVLEGYLILLLHGPLAKLKRSIEGVFLKPISGSFEYAYFETLSEYKQLG